MLVVSSITIDNKITSEKQLLLSKLNNYVLLLESGALSFESIAQKDNLESTFGEKILIAELINRDYSIPYSTKNTVSPLSLDKTLVDTSFEENLIIFTSQNNSYVYLSPVIFNGHVVGVFHVTFIAENIMMRLLNYTFLIATLNVIGLLVSFLIIRFLVKIGIIKNLLELMRGSKEIAGGNLSYEVNIKSNDEIGELARSFDSMRKEIKIRSEKIEALLKQKDDFVNQLGHDLKNPLTPLTNLLPLLKNQLFVKRTYSDEDLYMTFKLIERNAKYIKNLVLKTLELAKLNAPGTKFYFEKCNLYDLFTDNLQRNNHLIKNGSVTFDMDPSLELYGDIIHLDQLFDNLLTNAIKYSSDDPIINVSAKKQKDIIQVSISDNGIGMTEEQIKLIFDEFYKVDPARHDFESSGLGMAIAKKIVEKHGGRIWVESEGVGKGTTINFTLSSVYNKQLDKELMIKLKI
jgi:signal transduction histidine kinase